jgi:hypothetical protein
MVDTLTRDQQEVIERRMEELTAQIQNLEQCELNVVQRSHLHTKTDPRVDGVLSEAARRQTPAMSRTDDVQAVKDRLVEVRAQLAELIADERLTLEQRTISLNRLIREMTDLHALWNDATGMR